MMQQAWKQAITSYDDRRDLVIAGNYDQTIAFCAEQFIAVAKQAIAKKGFFTVALTGGSSPKGVYQLLASPKYRTQLDWDRVRLFWSDERCVPPTDRESNYRMSMESGFASLPIPESNIFRMPAESPDLEAAAKNYETLILENVPNGVFDLVMLGMGEDGHTASLFPKTHGLHSGHRLVIANFIPEKKIWRMTFTYECINQANEIVIYIFGKSKAEMLKRVLTSSYDPDILPIQAIGTRTHKALYIVDNDAARELVRE